MMRSRKSRRLAPQRGPATRWDVARGKRVSLWQSLTPPQIFVASFVLVILLGTVGLKFLPGLYRGAGLSWIDALFTATSAVCVTGLIVVDTATHFTTAGQAFVLALIQIGGLGMLVLASVIIAALGGRLSLRTESVTTGGGAGPYVDARQLLFDVVRFTFVFEALGAIALWSLWAPSQGGTEALWPAVFHSVSAFCNAGFSTYSNSLIPFQSSPGTLLAVSALIVFGGIGFLTLEEIYLRRFAKTKSSHQMPLSIHSRLVIVTTLVLLALGWLGFALLEWNNTLAGLTIFDKLNNALFMSVTARTAGFNTVDYAEVTDSSNFLTILLMTIGGSPGSTAGGIKTTSFALLFLLAWSRLRGHETTIFGNRSIPEETIQRAVGLTVLATMVVALGVFALAANGDFHAGKGRFLARMFEAVSAFNTVGLSMNLTATLTPGSKLVLILLMFLGRVGPLSLAAALAVRRSRNKSFRYAYEDVLVG